MKNFLLGLASVGLLSIMSAGAQAAACMKVTLTGTQGRPPVFMGQAGAGTLVQFGDDSKGCNLVSTHLV
jgi:ribonuclease Z